jgi:phage terminase large subunit
MQIKVQIAEKLLPLLLKPKRIKIAVGGRGGSKSIAFADAFLKYCDDGERLCCAREFQNSIDDSVHSLLKARIIELQGLDKAKHTLHDTAKTIYSDRGGEIFYRGLARNIDALKSTYGINRVWVEEASTLSQDTIDILAPTVREAGSELWFSLNRGSSKDPFSQKYLKPYDKEIEANGYYEDEHLLIVEINWQDNPFFPEVLNQQRLADMAVLPRTVYDHIWEGKYSDTVEGAIIFPEWFDACIDAHKKLNFDPVGIEVVSHDPSDQGMDDKALCYRHGAIIKDVAYKRDGDVEDGFDWALDYAISKKVDEFIWDADGLGLHRRLVKNALEGKRIGVTMFRGQETADDPDQIYEPIEGEERDKRRTNKEVCFNKRAQYYLDLRNRIFRTYKAVVKGEQVFNPDELISFSSEISELDILRSEICRIPQKNNGTGRFQVLSKPEMKTKDIESPNGADCVMMSLAAGKRKKKAAPVRMRPRRMTDRAIGY